MSVSNTGTVEATLFDGSGASLSELNASNISTGTVPIARIGTGTKNTTTFLRGDNTFVTAATYSASDLYIKRIWKKGATESNWTTVFNATTGAGTLISTSGTYTQINLNYTGSSTDMYMIEFSNSSDNRIGKGVAHVGSGTFQSTAGMAVISYDAYETVDGSGQLKIAKYFAQVQRQQVGTSAALGFRYASKVVV